MCQKEQNVARNNTEKKKEVLENAEMKERRLDYRKLEHIFSFQTLFWNLRNKFAVWQMQDKQCFYNFSKF